MKTALVTGGNGNLGRAVADLLRARGVGIVRFDLPGSGDAGETGDTVVHGDIRDHETLAALFENHRPDAVYHLASLLSGSSEADPAAAWAINATASFDLLRLAHEHRTGMVFFASTIGTYGPGLPDPLPEDAPQWPRNVYGATKVAVERLGYWYRAKHGLDFRCLRFPLVISPFAPPGATTAYPSHAFRAAAEGRAFTFPVSPENGMSTLFVDDVISSIVDVTFANRASLTRPAYNLHAFRVSAREVGERIRRNWPDFTFDFVPDPTIDALLEAWPDRMDDSSARADWGWRPACDFEESATRMIALLQPT